MFLKTKKARILRTVFIVAGAIILSFGYNNCGDVGLHTKMDFSSFNADGLSTFPIPNSQAQQTRVVFLMDMSVSMAFGLCKLDAAADSADLTQPCDAGVGFATGTSLGIRPGKGVDSLGTRFAAAKKWIAELNQNSKDPASIQYLIIPFNGSAQIGGSDSYFLDGFVGADKALQYVADLEVWQNKSLQYYRDLESYSAAVQDSGTMPGNMDSSLKLSTTNPALRIEIMKNLMKAEAETLAQSHILTQFELVVMSDGVPKPRTKNFKNAIRRFWQLNFMPECSTACGTMADNLIDGMSGFSYFPSCTTITYSQKASNGDLALVDCFQKATWIHADYSDGGTLDQGMHKSGLEFLDAAKTYWGDPRANSPNNIALQFLQLKKTIENSATSHVRTSLAWLNPARISPDVTNDKENFMIRTKLIGAAERLKYLNDPPAGEELKLPFAIAGVGEDIESYKISSLQVWNPFVRVDKNGKLVLDSDGDGLSDEDEIRLGFNPTNPRTNGRCLDSLTAKGLCPATLSCDPSLDVDGDGLNECEELILGTDPNDFDSDGDGIPDGIEYLLGSDPNKSDLSLDDNKDKISNIQNLIEGVHPNVALNSMNPAFRSTYNLELNDYVQQIPNGPRTGRYNFQITNIPFLAPLESAGSTLYTNAAHTITPAVQLVGGAHPRGQVQAFVLVRIDNIMHNGDIHWGYIPFTLQSHGQSPTITLDKLIFFDPPDPLKTEGL